MTTLIGVDFFQVFIEKKWFHLMKLWCIYHARRHTDSHFNNGVFCSVSVAMSAMRFPKAVDVIETLEVVIKNSFLDFIF